MVTLYPVCLSPNISTPRLNWIIQFFHTCLQSNKQMEEWSKSSCIESLMLIDEEQSVAFERKKEKSCLDECNKFPTCLSAWITCCREFVWKEKPNWPSRHDLFWYWPFSRSVTFKPCLARLSKEKCENCSFSQMRVLETDHAGSLNLTMMTERYKRDVPRIQKYLRTMIKICDLNSYEGCTVFPEKSSASLLHTCVSAETNVWEFFAELSIRLV